MDGIPVLTLVIWLPALAGLLLCVLPGKQERLARWGSLVASLVVFVLTLLLFLEYPGKGMHFVEDVSWVEYFNIRYKLGIDGISLAMVVLTGILTPLSILASWGPIKDRVKAFYAALLFLETGMLGVFCALDLFVFYVFWEAMLIPMVLLIGIWGGPNRVYASVKFILYTMAGSLLMFAAILYCYATAGTFDILDLQQILPGQTPQAQLWLFGAFALAFAIKVPMFPFHTWLPDAHTEAPTAGSAILAGVLLKMGGYGFLRLSIPFFPSAAVSLQMLFIVLSVIGIIYGALMAMAQSDIKRLIAYSSVSHLGFVMLGMFAFDHAAVQGAVIQMVNHGVSTGALFLLFGILYDKAHRRSVDDFGGLAKVMPVYAALFLITALSSIGLPGLNGFVGEFLILAGSFRVFPVAAALGAIGVILSAIYLLVPYRRVFFGKVNLGKWRELTDVGLIEMITLVPLILLMVLLGVLPWIVLDQTGASVTEILNVLNGYLAR